MKLLMTLKVVFLAIAGMALAGDAKPAQTKNPADSVNWPEFMAQQDMVWNKTPKRWNEAPFFGNGMLGLFLYQEINNVDNEYSTGDQNVLSLHLGRGDYYDNRAPLGPANQDFHTWIYRGRLPIGFFKIKSIGDITGVDWRMDLWNAKLVGSVTTTKGSYEIEGKVHAEYDSFYWSVKPSEGEQVDFEWQAQKAYSYARTVSEKIVASAQKTSKEVSHFYTTFAATPYPDAPAVQITTNEKGNFSKQVIYGDQGEQVTAWKVLEGADGKKELLGTIAFSKEMGVATPEAEKNLARSLTEIAAKQYHESHEAWWNEYYPRSFVSVSDDFWEQFYWIQIYKYASATRADGMLIDTAGPWYQPGFHPLVWSDLNVQLDYWLPLVANRLDIGHSVMNKMDEGMENMIKNVPKDWQNDCLNAGVVFPGDFRAPVYKLPADHIVWLLHNYWTFCQYGNDKERMRDGLFPLLKRANATYLRYIQENPTAYNDGKLHIKSSWSPEAATGPDMNYTIALIRWSSKILLQINEEHNLNDPKAAEWQNLLDNLVDYQIDENGLRLGRDHAFDKAHRHYSHLLAYFPLYEIKPDQDYDLVKKSVDHWLKVTEDTSKIHDSAMPVTGYTCTGAAAMYAGLGDAEKAFEYLQKFSFVNIYSNTLYAEGREQLIETPLSAASSMHDMFLQSWDGRVRIMPAVPEAWQDLHFDKLLCEGGIEVSADRTAGQMTYAKVDSPEIAREIDFRLPIENPVFTIVSASGTEKAVELKKDAEGFYRVNLDAGASLVAKRPDVSLNEVAPVKTLGKETHIFGNSGKYDRVRSTFKSQYKSDRLVK